MADQNIWDGPLQDIRAFMESLPTGDMPGNVRESCETIGGVPCRVLNPANPSRTIVYFHGGGFCLGLYPATVAFAARIAEWAGARVVVPDYRLAPECPYPAALQDAAALLSALHQCNPVAMGDSSGCALMLSALLRKSGIMPAALVLITPMLDFAGKGESLVTRAQQDPFQMKDPLRIAKIYLGGHDPHSPEFSPLYGSLANLPPMLVHAADNDVFLSDATRLHERTAAAGVQTQLKVWPGMWHTFHLAGPVAPDAARAMGEIISFIKAV